MFRALLCPSSGARQTAVAASGFRMNVEVDVFSAVVRLIVASSWVFHLSDQRRTEPQILNSFFLSLYFMAKLKRSLKKLCWFYVLYQSYMLLVFECRGRGSSVGIATGYGLDGPGIESRLEARFSAPVQTCPGAHPASCTMGTGSFPGVKSGRDVTLTPHRILVPWS
jgi:hypothetical protein